MSSARLLLLAIALSSDLSGAAPVASSIQVQLEVRSALNCASRSNLVERVRARSPKIDFVDNAGEVVIGVTFSRQGDVFAGELAWLEADKPTRVRRVDARSCELAVDAVALILAITLDPSADVEAGLMTEASVDSSASGDMTTEPSSTTVNVEPAASYESNTAGAATSAWSEASQRTTTDLQEQDGAVGESNPNLATHRDRSWVFSGGVAGALRIGHAPFPMPGVAAFLTLDPIASWPFAPKFVVSGDWSWSPTSKQAEGSADFELGALSFDVCPSHFTWTNVRLDTCIGGSLGAFSATGVEARNAAGTVVRPIFGFGLTGLLYLDLSDHFALSLRVAPQLNLVRDEFEFGDRVFHRVPPVSILLYLGLVAR